MTRPQAGFLVRVAGTGTSPCLFRDREGVDWWAKWPGNPHGMAPLANELIVGRLGAIIGAPVPPVSLLDVPDALVRRAGLLGLLPGPWVASRQVQGDFSDLVQYHSRDDNAHRLPRFLALWLWASGFDEQYLYDGTAHQSAWSIDYGMWLDCSESDWLASDIRPNSLSERPAGYAHADDPTELSTTADIVESVTDDLVRSILSEVPIEWNIPPDRLDRVAEHLIDRRPAVADHLRVTAARSSRPTGRGGDH